MKNNKNSTKFTQKSLETALNYVWREVFHKTDLLIIMKSWNKNVKNLQNQNDRKQSFSFSRKFTKKSTGIQRKIIQFGHLRSSKTTKILLESCEKTRKFQGHLGIFNTCDQTNFQKASEKNLKWKKTVSIYYNLSKILQNE